MLKKEDFFFNENEKKLFFKVLKIGLVVIIGMILVALLIVIVIPRGSEEPTAEMQAEIDLQNEMEQSIASESDPVLLENRVGIIKRMELYSFVIPEAEQESLEPAFYRFRTPLSQWPEVLVMKYWIDPVEIGIDNITKENDKNIKELFDGIQ